MKRIIFLDVPREDMFAAMRAVQWLMDGDSKDAFLSSEDNNKHFYVKRNKASITVRPC